MKLIGIFVLFTGLVSLALAGCSSTTVRYVDITPPKKASQDVPEEELLDVGVLVLDANIPEYYDDIVAENITPEVRRAEANYIANYLKEYLQSTGNWGAVRVVPRLSNAVDIVVVGAIIHSDGERQVIDFGVRDSRGVIWFEKTYKTLASKYAYDPEVPDNIDPFQTTYRKLADSMLDYMEALSSDEKQEIRTVSKMRFAREITPEAFGDYLSFSEEGEVELLRLPANDDPVMDKVEQIRDREYLFIDTLDEYYSNFASKVKDPLSSWRQQTYDVAIALREDRNKARVRLIAGISMVLSGAVMQRSSDTLKEYAGYTGVIGGSTEVLGSIANRANIRLLTSRLQEIGLGASEAISPYAIELENATYSLEGTVDEQFDQLKELLREQYYDDLGVEFQEEDSESDTSVPDVTGEETTDELLQGTE
ncbi:MAG: hypothetical protein OXH84_09300 [Gammaproteobacteria bacterium]|nr:hypothetical protein [Gammaproteobacteria bacterium]